MNDSSHIKYPSKLAAVMLFALAMAFVEAAVVVYLRALYYPEGFGIVLKELPVAHLRVEVARELSTLVMLTTVAWVAGKFAWERFGYFLILFGVWDIFYYVWLKATLDWPTSLFDMDVLFLVPVPWLGPVIAPVLVSMAMILCGVGITRLYARGLQFRPGTITWGLTLAGSVVILYSFMRDADLAIRQLPPRPYLYSLLVLGLLLYAIAFWLSYQRSRRLAAVREES